MRYHCWFACTVAFALLSCLVFIMLHCKVCGTLLEGSDCQNKCIVHQQCSRNSPCPLDESQEAVNWGEIKAFWAAALGVRQAETKRSKTTSGKGKRGVLKGSLLHGVDPPGANLVRDSNFTVHWSFTVRFLVCKKLIMQGKTTTSWQEEESSHGRRYWEPGLQGFGTGWQDIWPITKVPILLSSI